MVDPHLTRTIVILLGLLVLLGCRSTPAAEAPATPIYVEVPVTVEVTRVVQQPIIVEATPTPTAPCAPRQAGDSPMITLGAILPFSSPGALQAGFAMQTALNLAVLSVNDQGGVHGTPVRLVTYDSAGIPERGAQFAERLILDDCAVGIVGFYHSSVALAVIDVAHRYGIPVIVAEAASDEITARGYPEVFRIAAPNAVLTAMPAEWLAEVGDYNQNGIVSAVVIGESNANIATLDRIVQQIQSRNAEAESLTVDLPTSDFTAVIARILNLEHLPDAVFIYIKGTAALALHTQLLDAGINPQRSSLIVLHNAGLDSDQFWAQVPGGVGAIVARIGPWPGAITTLGQEFALRYDQQAGKWPESFAFSAYDAVWLIVHAMRQSDTLASNDVLAALRRIDVTLAGGRYRFPINATSPAGARISPVLFQQWMEPPTLYLQFTQPNQRVNDLNVIWPPPYRTAPLATPAP